MTARTLGRVFVRRMEDYYARVLIRGANGGPTYDEARRDFVSATLQRWPR